MSRIQDLEAFIAIIDHGSLTAAARELGRPLQSVSRSLAALEASMGVELIRRTTRSATHTDTGLAFYQRVKPAVEEIQGARQEAANQRREPAGTLRIGAPVLFAPEFVMPVIAEYMRRFPKVQVELLISDTFVDLSASGIDVMVRIGNLPDSSLRARRLGALRRVVFGSPAYFAAHGRPTHPQELAGHQCLVRTVAERTGEWMFQIDGKARAVKVSGGFRSDAMSALYAGARLGLGLGYSPYWQVQAWIEDGSLELALEDFEPTPVPVHALWVGANPSRKVREMVELLRATLQIGDD
ncbi:MAG: LysR family transcriptional regulator [Achromobacter pestifer]